MAEDNKNHSTKKKAGKKKAGKGVIVKRVIIGILIAILIIILVATAVFYILRSKGKKSIYENVNNSAPVIPGLFDDLQDLTPQDESTSLEGDKNTEASETVKGTDTSEEGEQQGSTDHTDEQTAEQNTAQNSQAETTAAQTQEATQAASSQTQETTSADSSQNPGYVYQAGDVKYNGSIYRYNRDIMTFLVMGIDSSSEIPTDTSNLDYIKGGQADANFLLVMNPHTKKIACIALNRNTMTDIDVFNSSNQYLKTINAQLCLQHAFGDGKALSCERARQTISEMMYNLPIHGYCSIRMAAIKEINDSVGGVEVTLSQDFEPLGFKAGSTVRLDGNQAYTFLRHRDKDQFDSATTRLGNEKIYLTAFMKVALNKTKADISYPLNLYNSLSKYLYTDLSADKITYLASELIGYSFDDIAMYSLPGSTVMGERFEEFYLDKTGVIELMLKVFYEIVG